MDRYFNLYSYCHPVKGCKRAVVCDLQRNIIQPIPLILYDFLEKSGAGTYGLLTGDMTPQERNAIEVCISYLYHNEFGYFSLKPIDESLIEQPVIEDDSQINNAIVDFSTTSVHGLEAIVAELGMLGCKALEIRYYYQLPLDELKRALLITARSSIEKVEVCVEKSVEYKLETLVALKDVFPKLSKLTLSNTSDNVIYKHNGLVIISTTEIIRSESKCGVTGDLYCIAEHRLYWESMYYNNCLYKKIAVDKEGYIKNCPSMKERFGHVTETTLTSVVQSDGFKKYWHITKDKIEVCSQCELRYVCQDCRAYTIETGNPYSKPLKCRYDPRK